MFPHCILWLTLNANEHCEVNIWSIIIWASTWLPCFSRELNKFWQHLIQGQWGGDTWGFGGGRINHSAISGHKRHFSLCFTPQEFLLSRRPLARNCFSTTLFSKNNSPTCLLVWKRQHNCLCWWWIESWNMQFTQKHTLNPPHTNTQHTHQCTALSKTAETSRA